MFNLFKKSQKEEISIVNRATFLDVFYKEKSLFVTLKKKEIKEIFAVEYFPYFYLSLNSKLESVDIDYLKNTQNVKGIALTEENIYKLVFENVEDLIKSRNHFFENEVFPNKKYKLLEYDIPFVYRFLLDKNLSNFKEIEYTLTDDNRIKEISVLENTDHSKLKSCAFDIEVLVPENMSFPKPGKDKIISISYVDNENEKVVFFLLDINDNPEEIQAELLKRYKDLQINLFTSEVKLIEGFRDFIDSKNIDIVYTYNGIFDFEYIAKSYKEHTDKEFLFSKSKLVYSKSKNKRINLEGTVHIDVYAIMRLLRYLQVFNYPKLDLNSLYSKLTGNAKLTLPPKEMREVYLAKDYYKIIDYNLDDSIATLELANNYNSIIFEISDFINFPVNDLVFSSAGAMVERLFFKHYLKKGKLIPNKPTAEEIGEREKHKFSGAYVKSPVPGLHKNIAVLDFRSYHISILISYNISPETVDCLCCEQEKTHQDNIIGHYICQNKKGFVPEILEELLTLRAGYKDKAKTLSKDTQEYRSMHAKQYALKIFLASTYGYMGYSGARWYSKSTLEIMYYLVRLKIQDIIRDFETKGYMVIYGDTDSCFIQFRNIDKLKSDLKELNADLPPAMTLELEDIYMSGLFVHARDKERGAKKKYALLDYNGNLKIKGFEYVRHDWCPLVKETQKEVLKLVLMDQDSKKALSYLNFIIDDLKNKDIPNSKLVIQTFVHKSLESYKTLNPAMSAIKNAKKAGKKFKVGDLVEFIITEKGKSISDKAQVVEFVKDKDYDVEYYINNQLVPAILPILEELGLSKEELLSKTKQKGLADFK
ncbi:MAG: DNA-directed DNA polymerase [archaeon]|jgi:DNA polymerase elongation subunit (family B)